MGTFADGICGDDVARGDVACAGRVRRVREGGRGGGIYGAYVRVARWRVRGARTGVDGRGVDGVRDPGARDGGRSRGMAIAHSAMRDGVVTARGRGVGWRARGRWREVRVARAGAGAARASAPREGARIAQNTAGR